MNSLNEHHINQFVDILRFSRLRRTQLLNDIGLIFEEESEKELNDTTYNKDEVEHIVNNIRDVVKNFVGNEVLNINHMNILLLQQFCKQAEFWHLNLLANISELENRQLLNNIKQFEENQFQKNKLMKQNTGKLEPLINEGPVGILKKEIEDLKKENEQVKQDKEKLINGIEELTNKNNKSDDKIKELENKINSLHHEIKKLQSKKYTKEEDKKEEEIIKTIDDAIENKKSKKQAKKDIDDDLLDIKINNIIEKSKLADIKGSKINIDELMKFQNIQTQEQIKSLTKEVESLRKDLDGKLSQSSPVQNLKRMLIERNNQYKALKTEVLKYNPDYQFQN